MKYNKMEKVEGYGFEDKSVIHREQVADSLWKMLQNSPYTYAELSECLGWESWKLSKVLAGDEEIGLYELTHITGALGYTFNLNYSEIKLEAILPIDYTPIDITELF